MHRPDIAELRGAPVPASRQGDILLHTLPAFMKRGKAVLRRRKTLRRGAAIPLSGLFQVCGDSRAFGEAGGDLGLRRRIALRGGHAQGLRANPYRWHRRLP